jgi:hypothetical protein
MECHADSHISSKLAALNTFRPYIQYEIAGIRTRYVATESQRLLRPLEKEMLNSTKLEESPSTHDHMERSESDVNSVKFCNGIYCIMLNEGHPAISGVTFCGVTP